MGGDGGGMSDIFSRKRCRNFLVFGFYLLPLCRLLKGLNSREAVKRNNLTC